MEKKPQEYNCIYCQKEVSLDELLQVELKIKEMDSEEMEYVWDQFNEPSMELRKIEKYSHMSEFGYPVLNVYMDCFQKALKKYLGS